ncbi:MAG: fasciclin domain-containing protein [Niabella sp.]|nr:fasciclin domain-containing protein [Niabella sp.]
MRTKNFLTGVLVAGIFALSYMVSCKKIDIVTATTTDVNIYDYLVKNGSQYSEFAKMLQKAGYSNFLNAYGSYTVFAPTNDGVKAFLQETGKASIDAFSEQELQDIVKLHLLQDTVQTGSFTDGKLAQVTMLGQYLVTGVTNQNGASGYTINKQALVVQPNIALSNGIIHAIDHVLKAATKTVAQTIEANADYSIFTQALKETGFYDSLNIVNNPDTTYRFLTAIAETNKALADSGLSSYAALKAKYCNTGDPKNVSDSLHMFVAYHITTEARYIADIVSSTSIPTLALLEVITPSLDGQAVLLNDVVFNGTHERGIELNRSKSDLTSINGVVHEAEAHFAVKIRVPVRVDFEPSDQPELRKLTSIFRKATTVTAIAGSSGGGYTISKGFFEDVTWNAITSTTSTVSYNCMPPTSTTYYGWHGDYLRIPEGNTSRNKTIEFRTPLLVKGRYKVWVCYYRGRASTNNPAFPNRVDFDGQPMQRTFDFSEQKPVGTPSELEALGYKQYTEVPADNSTSDRNNVGRLVGTINVTTTDRHTITLTFLHASSTGQELNYLDIIQFIPVNDNQTRPVFGRDGTIIP